MNTKTNNKFELIDNYILEKFSNNQKSELELEIFNNPVLLSEYHFKKNLIDLVREEGGTLFAEFLYNSSKAKKKISIPFFSRPVILIPLVVSSIVVTLIFLTTLFNNPGQKQDIAVIADNSNTEQEDGTYSDNNSATGNQPEITIISDGGNEEGYVSNKDNSDNKNSELKNNIPVLADAFVTYKIYEIFIDRTKRNDNSIKAISPSTNQEIINSHSILFKWETKITDKISIKIYDNKENLVYEKRHISGSSITVPTHFSPGLYYWKIETKFKLLYINKFLIK